MLPTFGSLPQQLWLRHLLQLQLALMLLLLLMLIRRFLFTILQRLLLLLQLARQLLPLLQLICLRLRSPTSCNPTLLLLLGLLLLLLLLLCCLLHHLLLRQLFSINPKRLLRGRLQWPMSCNLLLTMQLRPLHREILVDQIATLYCEPDPPLDFLVQHRVQTMCHFYRLACRCRTLLVATACVCKLAACLGKHTFINFVRGCLEDIRIRSTLSGPRLRHLAAPPMLWPCGFARGLLQPLSKQRHLHRLRRTGCRPCHRQCEVAMARRTCDNNVLHRTATLA